LQVELKEYRKRLSWVSQNGAGRGAQASTSMFGSQQRSNSYNNDFQFEFPKFGDLPANNLFDNSSTTQQKGTNPGRSSTLPNNSNRGIPGVLARSSMSNASSRSQANTYGSNSSSPMGNAISVSPAPQPKQSNSVDSLSGLFSPSTLEASRLSNSFGYFPQTSGTTTNGQATRGSFEQNSRDSVPGLYASSSNTDSPASSADSHNHVSSIGTSPEPSLNSPGNKLNDYSLNTINEEGNLTSNFGGELTSFCDKLSLACGNKTNPVPPIKAMSNGDLSGTAITPGFDPNGINWLAQQNGGLFDPELFGDYRESQDAVVSQDFGAFFNDAFPLPDLGSPEHPYNALAPSPAPKVDLMKQVEAAREGEEEVVPGEDRAKMMTCNKIWSVLRSFLPLRKLLTCL
jgi:AP-1-like transcription factor